MKKLYTVKTVYGQVDVVADTFGTAETVFKIKYPDISITSIDISRNDLLVDEHS